jgi:hypothetical protein
MQRVQGSGQQSGLKMNEHIWGLWSAKQETSRKAEGTAMQQSYTT